MTVTSCSLNDEGRVADVFMKPPSKEAVDGAVIQFIDRTSNSELAVGACAVCARKTNVAELRLYRLDCIPSPHRLQPVVIHPCHNLFDGMLLHPRSVMNDRRANVCVKCFRALDSNRMPQFALANGL